ncbi:2-C-methyl-D-erythritol 4-phosphate cytidylyltransferase [Pseudoalteromonas ruthenica]|uniref:2-C-methyl-D-erythritol 4-phosphate cytidylyltransferase n=1 Tax=Pseudoalteromonas ruthenica TaxID=151081 RepID=UPI001109C9E0|nr:2-C-methyl-D-erythritol 4-phosphate cytidylyltransferase [Pseudoalteromonas ruthenica]TLX50733.1 2-C-methyl-D-erythritol 4-phosphate cytidylyltransferase [Pseudoalteromonas ruthenica]
MTTQPRIVAIVPAAGVGSRMQSSTPKQYIELQGKTVLEHTLNKLMRVGEISAIKVAISAADEYFSTLAINKQVISTVAGGRERADSVLAALDAIEQQCPDWVLVHDAARPLVCAHDIENLIAQCCAAKQGGILAAKVRDTIKRGCKRGCNSEDDGEFIDMTIPREHLYQALTPQFFPYELLRQALRDALAAGANITDEASAMEWAGHPVRLITGRSDNFKITTPEDLQLANFLLAQQVTEFV